MNKGRICVSIAAETADEMISQAILAAAAADIVELRMDALHPDEIDRVFARIGELAATLLLTFRPSEQGGRRHLTVGERAEFWRTVPEKMHGRNYLVDLEHDLDVSIDIGSDKVIRSFHELDGRAARSTDELYELVTILPSGAVKVATTADDAVDAIGVWRLLERADRSLGVVPIAMGEAGKWTRILGPAYGAHSTYASLDARSVTAPGQLTAEDLISTFHVRDVTRGSRIFGVIGDPVSGSLSPVFQNAAFRSESVDAVFVPFKVRDIEAFFRRMVRRETREVDLNFAGFSVTMPHKQAVMPLLDEIEPDAQAIGAVNTVKIEDGRLMGSNTDAEGFLSPLRREAGELRGLRVAVLGAGGAARACAYGLRREGSEITVFARDRAKAEALADEFGVSSGRGELRAADFDVLVNATPIGMAGVNEGLSPVQPNELGGLRIVYDLVTSPARTPLVDAAAAAGIVTISGVEMLLEQGALQFEKWIGIPAARRAMRESLAHSIR